MSSHHIVKEKQEPALYIHHLGYFNEELLGQLLEWSPTVIVHEAAYEKVVSLGIKVDIIAGTITDNTPQEHTSYIDTDKMPFDAVLLYLIENGYPAVNIISEGRGINELEKYGGRINIVWLNALEKTFAIRAGFTVWKPAGTVYSFENSGKVTTTNLEKTENGNYEVFVDGFVSFTFDRPYLMLTELL